MSEKAPTAPKGRRITGADRGRLAAEIRAEYEAGRSVRQIAADTGRSYGFVHGVLRESGAMLRGHGGMRGRTRA